MQNKKQFLSEYIFADILTKEKLLAESEKEMEKLKLNLRFDELIFNTKDIEGDVKVEIGYSISSWKNLIAMEENVNSTLRDELKVLRYRKQVISSLDEYDLNS
ncbi:MAG: hypothetical protein WCG60_00495 [bacterium]